MVGYPSTSTRLVVAMPAFNEESGITEFIEEIFSTTSDRSLEVSIVVADDSSTDRTREVVSRLAALKEKQKVTLIRTISNAGHGPATRLALETALTLSPNLVAAVDGDGQFLGADIMRCVRIAIESDCDVVEGVRTNRNDRWYRKIATLTARLVVGLKTRGYFPRDANTPLRVYRSEVLRNLLTKIPPGSLTPNLEISSAVRRQKRNIIEVSVKSLPRRGASRASGTMFGAQSVLPSRRFVRFAFKAGFDLLVESVSPRRRSR